MDFNRRRVFLLLIFYVGCTFSQYDKATTPEVLGYVKPPTTVFKPDITENCFAGLNFRTDCQICAWGSGTAPHYYHEMEMESGKELVIDDSTCTQYCKDYGVEPHDCNRPIDPDSGVEDPFGDPATRKWKSYEDKNELAYASCALECAKMCESDDVCDAYSFRPRRKIPGRLDAQGAHCAMYNLDRPISKDAEVTHKSQLDCYRVEDNGGNPFSGKGFHWTSSSLVPSNGQQWCLECCDSSRTSWLFQETFVQLCDAMGSGNDDVPIDVISFKSPSTGKTVMRSDKEKMNLFDYTFAFGKRTNTIDDTLVTCKLNRYIKVPYLIGYNLTIGIQEYYAGGSYWRGVNWCYAEPIVATQGYWESTIKGKFEFMEVITVTNGPDPYNTAEYWEVKTSFDPVILSVLLFALYIISITIYFRKMSKGNDVLRGGAKGLSNSETFVLIIILGTGAVSLGYVLTFIGIGILSFVVPLGTVLCFLYFMDKIPWLNNL